MKRLLLTCLILACPFLLQANPYQTFQQQIIPTEPLQERVIDISPQEDGGVLVTFAGALYGDPILGERFGVAKLDDDGEAEWVFSNTLPHNGFEPAASISTADGGAWLFAFPDDDAPLPGIRAFRISNTGTYMSTAYIQLPFQPAIKLDAWPIADEGVLFAYREATDPMVRLLRVNTAGQLVWHDNTPILGGYKLLWQNAQTFTLLGATDSTLAFMQKDIDGNTLTWTEHDVPFGSEFRDAIQLDNHDFQALTLYDDEHPHIYEIYEDGSFSNVINQLPTDSDPLYLAQPQQGETAIIICQNEHEPAFTAIPSLVAVEETGDVLWRKYADIESNFGVDFSTGLSIETKGAWSMPVLGFKLFGGIYDNFSDPMVLPTFKDTWSSGYYYDQYAGYPMQLDVQPPEETVARPEGGEINLLFKVWNSINDEMDLDVWYEYGWYQGSWDPAILPQAQYSAPQIEELIVPEDDYSVISRSYNTPDLPAFVNNRQVIVRVSVGLYPYQIFARDYFSIDVAPETADLAGDAGLTASMLPTEYALGAVYPNPFNSSTRASVTLPESAELRVNVYDVTGRLVAELANGVYTAGAHDLTFNADHLASGIYFLRAIVPGQLNATRKLVLVR